MTLTEVGELRSAFTEHVTAKLCFHHRWAVAKPRAVTSPMAGLHAGLRQQSRVHAQRDEDESLLQKERLTTREAEGAPGCAESADGFLVHRSCSCPQTSAFSLFSKKSTTQAADRTLSGITTTPRAETSPYATLSDRQVAVLPDQPTNALLSVHTHTPFPSQGPHITALRRPLSLDHRPTRPRPVTPAALESLVPV